MQLRPSYITKRFTLLCLSSLFFFFSFNMILPELNGFIETIGGHNYKGFILFSFTVFASLSRPFSGKLVDHYGRVPTMVFGSIVACLASFFYPWATSLLLFFALRCFHGLSTGFTPTGNSAMMADIIPSKKRGEAMGMLGFVGSIGMALGPVVGSIVKNKWGYDGMFFASSFIALMSILVISTIKETLPIERKRKLSIYFLKINFSDVFEPRVLKPSLVFLLFCLGYGTIYAVIPDLAKLAFNVSNLGTFFAITVSSSFIARFVGGYMSDRKGREPVVFIATLLLTVSLLIMGLAHNLFVFYLGAVVFGISNGLNSPSIFAWATDLSSPEKRGRAFATLFIGMELGIGLGAIISAYLFDNSLNNKVFCFVVMAILCSSALLIIPLWKVNYFKIRKYK